MEYYSEQIPCSSFGCIQGKFSCLACGGSGQDQARVIDEILSTAADADGTIGSSASAVPPTQPVGQVFLLEPFAYEYHPQFLDTFPRSFYVQLLYTVLFLTLTPRGTNTSLDTGRLPRGQWYTPTEPDGTPLPVQLHSDGRQLYVLWLDAETLRRL
ncbi:MULTISPECIES: hypothetical protein [unclassified Frankia]|uniref:hypothetical protein n=1 Tax=unclassified Frankia TaxID=2632575 RepID=UPI001041AB15|nr:MULTISPECIES: hypothetical protein [unclassified Frankia]